MGFFGIFLISCTLPNPDHHFMLSIFTLNPKVLPFPVVSISKPWTYLLLLRCQTGILFTPVPLLRMSLLPQGPGSLLWVLLEVYGYGFLHFCLLHFLVPAFVSCTIWSWSFQTSPISFFWRDNFATVWNYYFNFNSVAFKTLFSDIISLTSPLGFFLKPFLFLTQGSLSHPILFPFL